MRFWDLSPEEWDALKDAWVQEQGRQDRRTAAVESALYNIHRDRKRHPEAYIAKDFMPKYEREVEKKDLNKSTLERIKGMHYRYMTTQED